MPRSPWRRCTVSCALAVLIPACALDAGPDLDETWEAVSPATNLWPGGDVYLIVDTDFNSLNVDWSLWWASRELQINTPIRIHRIDHPSQAPGGHYRTLHGLSGLFAVEGKAPVGAGEGGDAESTGRALRHELGHVLGLEHTQARIDRDEHVVIHWDHVTEEGRLWYDVQPLATIIGPYDSDSVMHYSSFSFSDGKCAAMSLLSEGETPDPDRCVSSWRDSSAIGVNDGFTSWNYTALAALYCDPVYCGDSCASHNRCEGQRIVRRRLERFHSWQDSDEASGLAERYPDNVRW